MVIDSGPGKEAYQQRPADSLSG